MVLVFVINVPEFFLSHRLPLALAARDSGFDVHVATGHGEAGELISELGFTHHTIPLSRSGSNPFSELRSIWALFRLMLQIKPDIVHLVTIKPVLYGAMIARLIRLPAVVVAISGLGTVFVPSDERNKLFRWAVEVLYRVALRHPNLKAIFQNPDDLAALVKLGAVDITRSVLIRGSGVDLKDYPMHPEPAGTPVVTFSARLLKDKGVLEYVEAARILKRRGVAARFLIAGSPDPDNLSSVTEKDVLGWEAEGLIEVLGYRRDIPRVFLESNLVVLPSYREGLPKVLLEAAASGRAVVTTDTPGCRDAIEPEKTGLLVPVKNAIALADAIQSLLENPNQRRQMGEAGRKLAEREFTIESVVTAHMKLYRELLTARSINGP